MANQQIKVVKIRGRLKPRRIEREVQKFARAGYRLTQTVDNTGGFGGFYGVTLYFQR